MTSPDTRRLSQIETTLSAPRSVPNSPHTLHSSQPSSAADVYHRRISLNIDRQLSPLLRRKSSDDNEIRSRAPSPRISQPAGLVPPELSPRLPQPRKPKPRKLIDFQAIYDGLCFLKDDARDPRTGSLRIPPSLKPYLPFLLWVAVTIAVALIVLIWHGPVFRALDNLSQWLKQAGLTGRLILFACIFITTFPPLPLYSTLIVLSGFTFGLFQGFIISYCAALSGALTVFLLSRTYLRPGMLKLLAKSPGLKKVVQAIEQRPKLLFLIRVSPYPYNVMNTLLASSESLTFRTYFLCTALSLPKLVIHCGIGTTIRGFAEATDDTDEGSTAKTVKTVVGAIGIALCIGLFIYLFLIARRAVDEVDEPVLPPLHNQTMVESPISSPLSPQGRSQSSNLRLDIVRQQWKHHHETKDRFSPMPILEGEDGLLDSSSGEGHVSITMDDRRSRVL